MYITGERDEKRGKRREGEEREVVHAMRTVGF